MYSVEQLMDYQFKISHNLLFLIILEIFVCRGTGLLDKVCPGGQVVLLCTTDHILLEWNITVTNGHSHSETRSIPSLDQNPLISPVSVASSLITFSRDSAQGMLPLISTMMIDTVNILFNESLVKCTGINSSLVSTVALETTIYVINTNQEFPNPPKLAVRIHFESANFSVTLEWTQYSNEIYSITIIPEPERTSFTGSTSVELVMLYNTQYNVNITATLCGTNATNFTRIQYRKCGYPGPRDDFVSISSHGNLLIEGNTVNFGCPPGLTIIGSNSSTCMNNGQWEPDPLEIKCSAICGPPSSPHNGYVYPHSNTSLRVIIVCSERNPLEIQEDLQLHIVDCYPNGTWQPNPNNVCSSYDTVTAQSDKPFLTVTTAAIISSSVSSFLFLVFGLIIGGLFMRVLQARMKKTPVSHESTPVYEDVLPNSLNVQVALKPVNLDINEAYGQIHA